MDFSTSVRRGLGKGRTPKSNRIKAEDRCPPQVQLYLYPPIDDITLDEFEEYAINRQKLLRDISNTREKLSRGDIERSDYNIQLKNIIGKDFKLTDPEKRKQDHISHFILRLAYCRSEEQRRWFLSQEMELFRYRLSDAHKDVFLEFIESHRKYLPFEQKRIKRPSDTTDQNQRLLSNELWNFYQLQASESELFYKVDFTQVLDLVQRRKVIVKMGYAYFPTNKKELLSTLICNKFRTLLSQDLAKTAMFVGVVNEDLRIAPLLDKLKDQYFGTDFSNAASKLEEHVQLHQIDQFAKESFPPCMRHLHESLRKEHHLKHFSRLQYGLFLKSIGLTLDEALTFWREEFTKKMEVDKFEKQYAYNVRHSFGHEGKRTNYTPYSCMKIITGNIPGPGDHHGCPFRHWDHTHIEEKMLDYGVPQKQLSKISDYAQSSHYQLACQKYFEVVHGLPQSTFSLEHPSQYYYESRKVRCGGGTATTVKKEQPSPNSPLAAATINTPNEEDQLMEEDKLDEAIMAEFMDDD